MGGGVHRGFVLTLGVFRFTGISVAAVMKSKPPGKRQHESAGGSGSSPAKKAKGNKADAGDKKAKKKKDPNAPKVSLLRKD